MNRDYKSMVPVLSEEDVCDYLDNLCLELIQGGEDIEELVRYLDDFTSKTEQPTLWRFFVSSYGTEQQLLFIVNHKLS